MKTVRVHVAAGQEMEETRRAVEDVLEMLNRHFRPRGVEFVGAGEREGDWTIALYWKDFGGMEQKEFEEVYEEFKKEKKPVIHVFFKEPDDGIAALKAFKEAFAERYGHLYCRFETVDAVRFQLAVQSLSWLPGAEAKEALQVEGGEVHLGEEAVAKLKNLPFAKLNAKRQSLLHQIDAAEVEVEQLAEQSLEDPRDADLEETLRAARVKRHDLKEELDQYDGFLCETAVFFAKELMQELDVRVRKARDLFERGQVRDANRLLDLPEMIEQDRRDSGLFMHAREARIQNIQAFMAKAKLVMADDTLEMSSRTDIASAAYNHAIHVAKEIRLEIEQLALVLYEYAKLMQRQHRFGQSVQLYEEALKMRRAIAARSSKACAGDGDVADTLNNLAVLHSDTQHLIEAEREFEEALTIQRRLATRCPAILAKAAMTLDNLGLLHSIMQRLDNAEREFMEALEIRRGLARHDAKAFVQTVAITLTNLANLHRSTQRFEEAERECAEALEIYRHLSNENPKKYMAKLALTLNSMGVLHSITQRLTKAEGEFTEALAIRRKLFAENPEAYSQDLAETLTNIANLHNRTKQMSEAESEYAEALSIRRWLVRRSPEAHEAELAMTLNNLALMHFALQQQGTATREFAEALEIYRRLALANPAAHAPNVAMVLTNLAVLHYVTHSLDTASTEYREALQIYRHLALDNPIAYEADTAQTLAVGGLVEKKLKASNNARTLLFEALEIYQRCEARTPGLYKGNLEWVQAIIDGAYDGQ